MSNEKSTAIAEMFKAIGYDYKKMKPGEYDIRDKGIDIHTWDCKEERFCWKRVNKIMYKGKQEGYSVKKLNDEGFLCSGEHLLYIIDIGASRPSSEVAFGWQPVKSLCGECSYKVLDDCLVRGSGAEVSISKLKEPIEILDIEVEGTNCYFANGILSHNSYGNPETTPGGNALKFYATMRLDVRRKEPIRDGDETLGAVTQVHVVKNKVALPFRKAFFNIMYGVGIDREADVIATACDMGILSRAGAWYSYNKEQLACGLESTVALLKERPEIIAKIWEDVLKVVGTKPVLEQDILEEKEDE